MIYNNNDNDSNVIEACDYDPEGIAILTREEHC